MGLPCATERALDREPSGSVWLPVPLAPAFTKIPHVAATEAPAVGVHPGAIPVELELPVAMEPDPDPPVPPAPPMPWKSEPQPRRLSEETRARDEKEMPTPRPCSAHDAPARRGAMGRLRAGGPLCMRRRVRLVQRGPGPSFRRPSGGPTPFGSLGGGPESRDKPEQLPENNSNLQGWAAPERTPLRRPSWVKFSLVSM